MDPKNLKDTFFNLFGKGNGEPVTYFAPGRVNLIGEHTDYNNGLVFPCALDFGTYSLLRKNDKREIRAASTNFSKQYTINIDDLQRLPGDEWINYPAGVISEFSRIKELKSGFDVLFSGNIPNGAGLSSSASIEMVTAFAFNDLFGYGLAMLDLVKISQHAENNFVGMNCGIMDQFAVGFGKKDNAVLINCDTLEFEYVPIELIDYQLVIINTNKRRGLTDSKYNERRTECESALKMIRRDVKIRNLSELTPDQFNECSHLITDETLFRRARHVVTENNRVRQALKSLNEGSLDSFGRFMNESHDSLRYDYEVTGDELDTLVYSARNLEGVIGSRMTGAGFGGCTVNVVRKSKLQSIIEKLSRIYTDATGLIPEFYMPAIGDGVSRLQ